VAVEDKLRALGFTNVSHIAEFFGTAPTASRTSALEANRAASPTTPQTI